MNCELPGLTAAVEIIDSANKAVVRAYNCEWDDPVHESFLTYITKCNIIAAWIKTLADQGKAVCDRLEGIRVDVLLEEADRLLSQVNA